jgi:hypothetical protein
MPRDRVLEEEVTRRVKHGLNYPELLIALLLAGVRNIQPRPVGYKFPRGARRKLCTSR